MPRARSPEYPAIGLREAIEKIGKIYQKDYQNPLPKQVIATHMGYKGLSGASLPVVAALSKYGLLEGRGDETRVTDLAVAIIAHPRGTAERTEAIRQAAALPELFAELDRRFQSGKASDQAIRSFLMTQKFIPSAADAAIRAYRDTKSLVETEAEEYSGDSESEKPPMVVETENLTPRGHGQGVPSDANVEVPTVPAAMRKAVFALSEGDVTLVFPEGLSAESVEDLKGYMEIFLRKAQREASKASDGEHEETSNG